MSAQVCLAPPRHRVFTLDLAILLDRGVGAAGVAIDSAPIKGVLKLPWSQVKST